MSYQEQGGGSESVVVNGTVEGVEIKPNGRFVVKVREFGSTGQYALNLNTKEQGLAQQMMGAIGQSLSFVCGLSHWTNQTGQPVTSKWINGVAPMQGQPQMQQQPQQQGWQQQPPQQQAQGWQQQPQQGLQPNTIGGMGQPALNQGSPPPPPPQPQEVTDDAFIRRVSFLAALEPAVKMLAYLPEEQHGVPALIKMADFFARTAIMRGQNGFDLQPQAQQQTAQVDEYDTPPPGDEDFPF